MFFYYLQKKSIEKKNKFINISIYIDINIIIMVKYAIASEHAKQLKTLWDPLRLQIVHFLVWWEKCVSEIQQYINAPQNLISHHLSVLKKNKFISSRKEGREVYYYLIHETFGWICNCLRKFANS